MLSSIHPFGERARRQRYGVTAAAFVIGSVTGGAMLGAVVAGLAAAMSSVGPLPGLAMLILAVAAAWDLAPLPVPSLRRQVDENWLPRYRGWVYGFGFGVQLGVGFATYVKSPLTYGLALAAVLTGRPAVAFSSVLLFGLVRGLSVLLTARVHTPDQLRLMFARLGKGQAAVRVGGAAAVTMLALFGLVPLL